MNSLESYVDLASERLAEQGFFEKSLNDLNLPPTEVAETTSGDFVPYVVMGNRHQAKTLVYSVAQYSCRVDDPSVLVGLAAQQDALGDEYCVIGTHVFDPKDLSLSKGEEIKQTRKGSFQIFEERMLTVVEATKPRDDQEVGIFGFSMGADVGVETTLATIVDKNKGIVDVRHLGVFEPARVKDRRTISMMWAFAVSGGSLFANNIEGGSVANLEARKIDLGKRWAKFRHDMGVNIHVPGYFLSDTVANLAVTRGFGHPTTLRQLQQIDCSPKSPLTFVGRAENSTVFPAQEFDSIIISDTLSKEVIEGENCDHSIGDNLACYAAFVLKTQGVEI